jgi:polar amino acid transport system substrate-binding protein
VGLAKGSALTACVSQAVDAIEASGELERLNKRWMSQAAGAPELH